MELRKLGTLPKRNPHTIKAVQQQFELGRPAAELAAKLGVSYHSIYRWVHTFHRDLDHLIQNWDDHQAVAALVFPGIRVSALRRMAADQLGLDVSQDQARYYAQPGLREYNKARLKAQYNQRRNHG